MSIYAKLRDILEEQAEEAWKVSFSELERLIGAKLPPSAFKYPGWWSNNPSNNAMTKIWLEAGWRTEQVDVPGQTLVFRRGEKPVIVERRGFRDRARPWEGSPEGWPALEIKSMGPGMTPEKRRLLKLRASEAMRNELEGLEAPEWKKKLRFEDLYGCMKGTIKIMPGVDVTAPAYTQEEWAEIEAERDRKWDEMLKPLDEKERR